MNRNILLVEHKSKSGRYNLAISRFIRLYRDKGDRVLHIALDSKFKYPQSFRPDKVVISIIFSWDIIYVKKFIDEIKIMYPHLEKPGNIVIGGVTTASLKDYIVKEIGITPSTGCDYDLDHVIPDFSFFKDTDECYLFSGRGCPIGCSNCVVPIIEPNSYEITNWREQIDMTKKTVVFMDNNILAQPYKTELFKFLEGIASSSKVFAEGSRKVREIRFDSGLDWRYLSEENVELISKIRHNQIRVAWDNIQFERGFDEGISRLLKKYSKSSRGLFENISCYLMYNYKDTIEDTLYRAYKLLYHYSIRPFLMRYSPLDSLKYKSYLSPLWSKEDAVDVGRFFNDRRVIFRVPRYLYYVGRDEDAKCISHYKNLSEAECIYDPMSLPNIDFSKPFKNNVEILKTELQMRQEAMAEIREKSREFIQPDLFSLLT